MAGQQRQRNGIDRGRCIIACIPSCLCHPLPRRGISGIPCPSIVSLPPAIPHCVCAVLGLEGGLSTARLSDAMGVERDANTGEIVPKHFALIKGSSVLTLWYYLTHSAMTEHRGATYSSYTLLTELEKKFATKGSHQIKRSNLGNDNEAPRARSGPPRPKPPNPVTFPTVQNCSSSRLSVSLRDETVH